FFVCSSRRRHTRFSRDWSSDVCSSDLLHVNGGDSAKEWRGIVEPVCAEARVACTISGSGYGPSDQMPFYIAGSPVLFFFTGNHQIGRAACRGRVQLAAGSAAAKNKGTE